MARFQRVLSLSMIVLAALLCSVELVRQSDLRLQLAFGAGAFFAVWLARREWRRVRAVKTGLPG